MRMLTPYTPLDPSAPVERAIRRQSHVSTRRRHVQWRSFLAYKYIITARVYVFQVDDRIMFVAIGERARRRDVHRDR